MRENGSKKEKGKIDLNERRKKAKIMRNQEANT